MGGWREMDRFGWQCILNVKVVNVGGGRGGVQCNMFMSGKEVRVDGWHSGEDSLFVVFSMGYALQYYGQAVN